MIWQFDYTNTVVLNLLQLGKYIIDCAAFAVIQLVFDTVVNNKVKRIKFWLIKRCNVRNPNSIFFDNWVGYLKTLFQWMEGNFDALFPVVTADYRLPNNHCLQGCNALLPINEDFLAGRNGAIFQTHIRIFPDNNVANRETLI